MTAYLRLFGVLAVLAGLAISGRALADKASSVADIPAKLIVEDNAKMFSPSAIDKAKKLVSEAKGFVEREVHVETYEKLSEADQKRYDDAKSPEAVKNFWKEWTKGKASGEKGIVIAINRSPGHVSVLTTDTMGKFFTTEHREEVEKRLLAKLSEVVKARKEKRPGAEEQALRDEGLISAVEYTSRHIPASFGERTVPGSTRKNEPVGNHGGGGGGGGGMGVGGFLCLALCIMLGVWLVVGLIRAFAGWGGGYYGGGPGYGGWGGGFFPSLLGGFFGVAAGMWMYDHFFGGHSSAAYAGDGGGDYGGGGGTEAINDAGDFRDDNYSGGDFDGGGDAGGGDLGGGSDFGGGGDFGGGDFGGGGDF